MTKKLSFRHVLARDGILHDQQLELDGEGRITAIHPLLAAPASGWDGWMAIPGIPNAHSHVFQRALAGYGEARAPEAGGDDSFWSWREAMYRLAASVTPEDLLVIARQGFLEMLASGFTSVAEFHYLHHLPDGSKTTAMADAVLQAAKDVGIRIRLLPVAYFQGGFGQAPHAGQRRFVHDSIDDFLGFLDALKGHSPGIAPHSLRAVPAENLGALLEGTRQVLGEDFPVHIHISEQAREVDDCVGLYGRRPVDLLADSVELGPQWNLVHATHVDAAELDRIVSSQAGVVICPITEAYLGDGLFPAVDFAARGRQLAVGSDSNCRIDAFEELRWLEFGQRLRDQRRARLADVHGLAPVFHGAVSAGANALGLPVDGIAIGQYADLLVYEESDRPVLGHRPENVIDALIVNAGGDAPSKVMVGGQVMMQSGEHSLRETTQQEFHVVVSRLLVNGGERS